MLLGSLKATQANDSALSVTVLVCKLTIVSLRFFLSSLLTCVLIDTPSVP